MIIIACIDNSNGMMFNKKRLSRDKSVITDIQTITAGRRLMMNRYSYSLFNEYSQNMPCCVSDTFLDDAGECDYCFVENQNIMPYIHKIEGIILYRWNRDYPSDFKFELQLDDNNLKLAESRDFQGFSHNRITKEVYIK